MKKNTLLYIALAGIGGYFLYKKFYAGKTSSSDSNSDDSGTTSKENDSDDSSTESTGSKKVTLTAGYEEDGIDRKLNKAKEILENVQSVSQVIIQTPKGQKNVKVSRKPKSRLIKRYKKLSTANCTKIKRAKRRNKCVQSRANALQWLKINNVL